MKAKTTKLNQAIERVCLELHPICHDYRGKRGVPYDIRLSPFIQTILHDPEVQREIAKLVFDRARPYISFDPFLAVWQGRDYDPKEQCP